MTTHKGISVWLDDNRPAPVGWVQAQNVAAAQNLLLHGNVEDLSLDYDLDNPPCSICDFKCGKIDESECKNKCLCHRNGKLNGSNLIDWMKQSGVWPKHKPVVHSTNARGRQAMELVINQSFPY